MVITKELVEMEMSSANTKSIMTWKHVIGKESMSNVVPAKKDVYTLIGEHTDEDGENTVVGGENLQV